MISILLLFILLVILIWERAYRALWKRNLRLDLSFGQPAVYAGKTVSFFEVLENRKRLPLPLIEAGFRVQKGLLFENAENISVSDYTYKRDLFSLMGMESIRRTYSVVCAKRGHYTISQVSIKAHNLLHTRFYLLEPAVTDELYVYAARTDTDRILKSLNTILGERESASRLFEDPFAFASIRNYTIQDPMKTINWKASARTGTLMVNTYTSVQSEQVFLYLDVEDRNIIRQTPLIEDSISTAATLIGKLIAKGLDTGIIINAVPEGEEGPVVFPPRRGRDHLKEIEQFLCSDFTKMKTLPFRDILQLPCGDRIPIFLSKNGTDETREGILERIGREGSGIWVLPHKRGEDPEIKGTPALAVIKREVGG